MKLRTFFAGLGSTLFVLSAYSATPGEDKQRLWDYFSNKYSSIETSDYINGNYVFDPDLREQWEDTEADFPPYEDFITKGEDEWNTTFSNGKTYASCFPGMSVDNIRPSFPSYSNERAEVITLELALNECRVANGEIPFGWQKGAIANLAAYLSFEAREKQINIDISSEGAKNAYLKGKNLFYGKRGQLNMACADCHVYYAGYRARANVLSSVIGQTSHFPVYRKKWGNLGTLHRRYVGCQKNIRAKPFKPQSTEYRNLEFFHTYMSNGLRWNGPQTRG